MLNPGSAHQSSSGPARRTPWERTPLSAPKSPRASTRGRQSTQESPVLAPFSSSLYRWRAHREEKVSGRKGRKGVRKNSLAWSGVRPWGPSKTFLTPFIALLLLAASNQCPKRVRDCWPHVEARALQRPPLHIMLCMLSNGGRSGSLRDPGRMLS